MLLCNLSTLPGFDSLIRDDGMSVIKAIEKLKAVAGKDARGGAMQGGTLDFIHYHSASSNFILRFAAAGESDPTAESSDAGKSSVIVLSSDDIEAILASRKPVVPVKKPESVDLKAKTA